MNQKHFTSTLQIKAMDDTGMFEGYASVFGVQDSDGDVIMKGAFKNTIAKSKETGRMPKMLLQHDIRNLVGKYTDIQEDENGLFVKGRIIMETQQGRETFALLKEGILDAMSVGFNIPPGGAFGMNHGLMIEEVDLMEISLVTFGANPEAMITSVKSIKDFERLLRDAGYSRKEATAIASHGYKAASDQSDSEAEALEATRTLLNKLKGYSNG
jgi:HK97 family phage prohead protease